MHAGVSNGICKASDEVAHEAHGSKPIFLEYMLHQRPSASACVKIGFELGEEAAHVEKPD